MRSASLRDSSDGADFYSAAYFEREVIEKSPAR